MNSYTNLNFAVCRKEMKDAASAYAETFGKVIEHYGDNRKNYHFTNDGIRNRRTGSHIEYVSLFDLPSDPDFTRLGSHEYTSAVCEEASEISFRAFNAIRSRIGRQKNKELGIKSKLLLTTNPGPGWIYTNYYLKRDDFIFNLENKVILASSSDNLQHLSDDYLDNLNSITDPVLKKRLLEGDWSCGFAQENTVIPYNYIVNCLQTPIEDGDVRLGVDVGGNQGYSDKTVIQPLQGNLILDPIVIKSSEYKGPAFGYDKWLGDKILEIAYSFNITNYNNVRIDACGIGQPIYAYLKQQGYQVYPFRGDAKPITRKFAAKDQFLNLRTQAYYELREKFRLQKLKLQDVYDEGLVNELSAIRYATSGTKLCLEDKKFTRRRLGHSPDYADALSMAALDITNNNNNNSKQIVASVI